MLVEVLAVRDDYPPCQRISAQSPPRFRTGETRLDEGCRVGQRTLTQHGRLITATVPESSQGCFSSWQLGVGGDALGLSSLVSRLVAERAPLNYPRARAEERAFLSLISSAHSKARKPRPYASGLPSFYRSGCEHERLTGCGRCPSPT